MRNHTQHHENKSFEEKRTAGKHKSIKALSSFVPALFARCKTYTGSHAF
jgi:hypothetical protein